MRPGYSSAFLEIKDHSSKIHRMCHTNVNPGKLCTFASNEVAIQGNQL